VGVALLMLAVVGFWTFAFRKRKSPL
jgi:hypothetical protein